MGTNNERASQLGHGVKRLTLHCLPRYPSTMPRNQKLKVFRAPVGFHDVYVAAPSRKAALEAWGSDHDLFARGMAEQVEDPELTREPLEKPGEIIRRLRGTPAEQIASLPKSRRRLPVKRAEKASAPIKSGPAKPRPKPSKPRPDRGALLAAQEALSRAEEQQHAEMSAFAKRQAELERERRNLENRHRGELAELNRAIEAARAEYTKAMRSWEG